MDNTLKATHPIFLIAAGSVTLASLAAAAHFSGLIPSKNEPTPAQLASAPAIVAPAPVQAAPVIAPPAARTDTTVSVPPGSVVTISPENAEKPAAVAKRRAPARSEPVRQARNTSSSSPDDGFRRVSSGDNGIDVIPARPVPVATPQPAVCHECGTVDNVREVASQGEGTGLGAVAGGVLGGVLGNQVGRGKGKDAATVIAAIGGAVAGHQIEKNVRSEKQYQVTVRFDDGNTRTYTLTNTQWHPGDRVRASGGSIVAL